MLRLFTFGGLRIERSGQTAQLPTQRTRDLLAYLITFRDRPHPRPVLADTLWPNLPEEKARRYLSDTLWRTRRAIGEYVTADEEHLWFDTSLRYWLDVEEFERVIATSQLGRGASPPLGLSPVDLQAMHATTDLYQGPYLDGLYHDWVLLEQERLREMYLQLLGGLQEFYRQDGNYETALTYAQRIVTVEPLHEAAHRELMRLYHVLGRNTEAIAQYKRCREILWQELNVAPAPETESLYKTLIQRVPAHADIPAVHLPAPARRPPVDLDELPLVGHEEERCALLGHLEDAASGRGGLVLLEGEPGIGKTRLAREIVAGARWRNIDATMVSAAEVERASSYALLLSALAPLLTPLRIRQLTYLVESIHLQAAAALIPSIAQTLPNLSPPPELPPPQARERLQQALVALVLGLAHVAPHLWVLEDLQWADAETLTLLRGLFPHLEGTRSLFLLTGRSADLRTNLAAWDTIQSLDQAGPFPHYTLERLHLEEIGSLVRELLDEEALTLTTYLAQESGGVPLYIVEMLKAWRDEGYLQSTPRGTWKWLGAVPTELPSYLGEAVIGYRLSRLAHLPRSSREVLHAAAVIGTEVDGDLLARVCTPVGESPRRTSTDPHLLMATDELLRLGLLTETDEGYSFSHEQVRRTVYNWLALPQRRDFHRRVALALETLYPEQFERLAHHFAEAGEEKLAAQYLTRAVERARELFAHEAACSCYDSLLDLLSHHEDRTTRWNILHARAEVLGWIGNREAQGRDLEEMLQLAHELSDERRLARTLHARSEWSRLQGRYQPAEEDALAALKIYERLGGDRAKADLLGQLGYTVLYTANYPQAADYLQQALFIYRDLAELKGQIHCLIGLASAADLAGNYALSFSYGQQVMVLAEATGDPHDISRAHFNTAMNYYDHGDLQAAEAHLHQALHFNKMIGARRRLAATHFYLGIVPTERDDFGDVQSHLDIALQIFREVQDFSWEGDTLAAMGRLALLQGDAVAGMEYLQTAYRRRNELGEPAYAVIDLSYLALAELALGDRQAAWQHSREAIAQLQAGLSGVEHPQRIYYNHYRVAEATGNWAAARAALEESARMVADRSKQIDDPDLREKFLNNLRANREIADALCQQPPPGYLRVRLARFDAPTHRRSTPQETIVLNWTVDAGEADAALEEQEGKTSLRRNRLLRLLREAEAAGASPTVADLAGALQVSPRTIRTDLATLRHQGHVVRTRGSSI